MPSRRPFVYRDELMSMFKALGTGVVIFLWSLFVTLVTFEALNLFGIGLSFRTNFIYLAAAIAAILLSSTIIIGRKYRFIATRWNALLVAFGFCWLPIAIVMQSIHREFVFLRPITVYPSFIFLTLFSSVVPLLVFSVYRTARGPVYIAERGHCTTCGYNLEGNESKICPECGVMVAQQ